MNQGYLKLYLGPMFSGKTTDLVRHLTLMVDIGMSTLYITHSDDNRVETGATNGVKDLSTHSSYGGALPSKIKSIKTSSLSNIGDMINDYQVIAIDECQFFSDLVENVLNWVNKRDKTVFCAALDGDAFRKPFGSTFTLIPHANEVKKLSARCQKCISEFKSLGIKVDHMNILAPFTARIVEGKEQKLIGGAASYSPMCRKHHNEHLCAK